MGSLPKALIPGRWPSAFHSESLSSVPSSSVALMTSTGMRSVMSRLSAVGPAQGLLGSGEAVWAVKRSSALSGVQRGLSVLADNERLVRVVLRLMANLLTLGREDLVVSRPGAHRRFPEVGLEAGW